MNVDLHQFEENQAPGRWFLPSLISAYFAAWPPSAVIGILLLDIGRDFGQSVGVMGQLQTTASIVTAFSALLVGAWSIRYNHKTLLTLGLISLVFSALGCFIAVNLPMMLFTYSLYGLGLAIVEPMAFTLVATHLPLQRRARAIGWIMAGAALATLSAAPLVSLLTELGSWRNAFLGFLFPISLFGLLLSVKGIPSHAPKPHSPHNSQKDQMDYKKGFREIFTNHSAITCLLGSALVMAGFQALGLYMISYFREYFLLSLSSAAFLLMAASLCYISGSLITGSIVNRFGRRPVTVVMAAITGILTIVYMNVGIFWLAASLRFVAGVFVGVTFTASLSLTLEQAPNVRGTMMSLNSAATYLGAAVGAGIGGVTLLWLSYQGVGIVLGALYLLAALLFHVLTTDPTSSHSA